MATALTPRARVLLVDDDTELAGLLLDYLQNDGFVVQAVHDGSAGLEAALSGRFDIVVLDITMPILDGIQVLGRIRQTSTVPVIMLTARGDDADRIVGLELGADDYVPKPCTPRELAARLRAVLKRARASSPDAAVAECLKSGPLTLWPGRRQAQWNGSSVAFTGTEFSLLETLVRHAGRAVSKSELSEAALGRPLARFDRSIDVHISGIRHKLGVLDDGRSPIETVIRQGYQWILV